MKISARYLVWLGLLLIGVLSVGTVTAAELVIIGNPDLPGPRLDAKDLERIYLGKQTRWENDEAIIPVMLKKGPVHDAFVEDFLGRSVHRFVTYWRQMVFTGKGIPPRGFANEQELVTFVAETPGALGYISAETAVAGVKVLLVNRD